MNEQDIAGRTPLFYAVRSGNKSDINTLISVGADLNLADKYGHTPAHVAAIKTGAYDTKASDNYFEILKLLKEKGADMTLKDYRGRTVNDCLKVFGNGTL
jgi:ankyrin repeat protein